MGNDDIQIKVTIDSSDVDKSMDKMAKTVDKKTDKIEKSFTDVDKTLKNTQKSMSNLFGNINLTGLNNAMNKVKQTVGNTMRDIQNQVKKSLNIDAEVNIKTNTSGSSSSGGGDGMSDLLNVGALGGIGKQISSEMSGISHSINNVSKSLANTFSQVPQSVQKDLMEVAFYVQDIVKQMQRGLNDGELVFEVDINSLEDVKTQILSSINSIKFEMEELQLDIEEMEDGMSACVKIMDGFEMPDYQIDNAEEEYVNFSKAIKEAQNEMLKLSLQEEQAIDILQKFNAIASLSESALGDMFKAWQESPSKSNLEPIVKEVERLSALFKKCGIDSQIFDDALGQLNQRFTSGGEYMKITSQTLKQLMVDINGVVGGFNKLPSAINKARIGAMEVTSFGDAVYKAKQYVGNFGRTIKQAFTTGFKDGGKAIGDIKKKIVDWSKAHRKAVKDVQNANKGLSGSFKGLLSSILPFATIYGAFNTLKSSLTGSMDAIETGSKFANVFGSETQNMTKWIEELNGTLGVSKTQMQDFSSTLYSMASNLGLTSPQAIQLSKDMSMLAQDMSSFFNIDSADAFGKLKSYLAGSTETLYEFGVVATEVNLQQFALSQGITKSYNAMSQAEKTMLRYQFAMQGLSQASGDLANTIDSPANRTRRLVSALESLKVALGNVVAPIWNAVVPSLIALANALTTIFNKIASVVNGILALFGMSIKSSGGGGGIVGEVENLGSAIDNVGSGTGGISDGLDKATGSAKKLGKELKGLMGIDELNVINSDKDGDSGSGGGSGSGSSGGGGGGLGGINSTVAKEGVNAIDTMAKELTRLQKVFLDIIQHFKTGFMAIAPQIESEFSKLKINVDKLGKAMADFFYQCWEHGLDKTVILLGGITGQIVATSLEITNAVVEVITGLFEHLNPSNNPNTQKFIDALNNLLLQIQKFIRDCGKWFGQFADACQPFINNLGDIATILGGIFAQVLADAIQLVRDFMNSWVGQSAIQLVADMLEKLSGSLEKCLGFIQDNLTFFESLALGIMGCVGAFKLINKVIEIWNGLVGIFNGIGAICSGVVTALGSAFAFLTSPIGLVTLAIGGLIAIGVALWKNWDTVKEYAKKVWDSVVKYFNDAGIDINGIVKDMWNVISSTFTTIWNIIKSIATSIWQFLKSTFTNIFNSAKTTFVNIYNIIAQQIKLALSVIQLVLATIKGVFTGDFTEMKNIAVKVWDNIKSYVSTVINGIANILKSWASTVLNLIKDAFNLVWNVIKGVWDNICNFIKSVGTTIGTVVKNFCNGVSNTIKIIFNGISTFFGAVIQGWKNIFNASLNAIKNTFSTIWNGIKSVVTTVGQAIATYISNAWNNIKANTTNVLNGIKSVFSTIWNGIKSVIQTVISAISSSMSNTWNNIKNTVSNSFNAIKTTIANIMNGIKSSINTIINNIKTVFSNGFNNAKATITNIFNSIKTTITNIMNGAKNSVSSIINGIKSLFTSGFNGAKNTVSNVFNSVKNTISNAMNSAKSTVSNMISKIKSAFNVKLSFPKIKLPHLSVTGKFSINPPSIPKFSISWWKNGGIMPNGSNMIFGMNGNTLLAGGENGTGGEAILPLNKLWNEMGAMFDKQTKTLANGMGNATTTVVVNLDGREVARSTVKNMKEMSSLGQLDTSWL